MSDPANQFASLLKVSGHSVTTARHTVFAALQNSDPLSVHELIAVCEQTIDRASVYRTLKLFEQLGVVQRLQIGWKYKVELSNAFQHHHHHMLCQDCGAVIDIAEDTALEQRLQAVAAQHGFRITEHQFEIQGICERCQNQQ